MEPAEVNHAIINDEDEAYAVRCRYELSFNFDNLSIYEHLWLLEEQFKGSRLIHLLDRPGFDLTTIFS